MVEAICNDKLTVNECWSLQRTSGWFAAWHYFRSKPCLLNYHWTSGLVTRLRYPVTPKKTTAPTTAGFSYGNCVFYWSTYISSSKFVYVKMLQYFLKIWIRPNFVLWFAILIYMGPACTLETLTQRTGLQRHHGWWQEMVPRAAVRRGRMCHWCSRGNWYLSLRFCGHFELCPVKEPCLWFLHKPPGFWLNLDPLIFVEVLLFSYKFGITSF